MAILLVKAITMFFNVVEFLIFGRIILSWLPGVSNSSLGAILYSMTEPILGPCRRMIDKSPLGGGMMVDFSPVVAIILMMLAQQLLIGAVYTIF